MVPLLLLSVVSVTLCLERAWFWIGAHGPSLRKRLAALTGYLRAGRLDNARSATLADSSIYGRLVSHLLDHGINDSVAIEVVENERPRIERFMGMLSTIITAAPLLGILGTVTGIIGSFELLGENQIVTDPREVSGGIAEALITTEVGLIIALVTLFPYMFYKGQIDRALGRMEVLIAAAQQGAARPAKTGATPPGQPGGGDDLDPT